MTIKKLHKKLIEKKISALELAREYIKKIKKNDNDINSFISVFSESATWQAKKAQKIIDRGENVPLLCGIPCAIKDNILLEGEKCTAGSKILENYIAPYNATVIKKLKKQGAVIIGKTNLDEFAMGSSTENSAFGVVKNPKNRTRVAGGSSGGSAAAVSSNFCQFALGSDTGGSIRQPSSFCGVFGFKPTYGAVSRYGLIAMASSLDQIGPIASSVEDIKIIFDAIKGKDSLDATSAEPLKENYIDPIKKLKVGIPKEYFIDGIEKGVRESIEDSLIKIKKLGVEVKEISLPHTEYALPVYYLIMPSEVSSNLSRYDGIKFGSSIKDSKLKLENDLFEIYSKIRGENFGREVKRRIILGTFALSAGYYDKYYISAQKVRRLIKDDFDKVFKKVDLIITPVTPTTAFKIGEKIEDPIKMYLADIFTVAPSLAGIPALSVPCKESDFLPVGMQIIGNSFQHEKIFQLAEALQK